MSADPLEPLRKSIVGILLVLNRDELRVVEFIASRLHLGQDGYGFLDILKDPRNWKQEALEEAADGAVYDAIGALKGEGPC